MVPKPSFAAVFCEWVDGFGEESRVDRIRLAAQRVSISISTAYAWMNGEQVPPSTKITAIAEGMGREASALASLIDADRRRLASKRSRATHIRTIAPTASFATRNQGKAVHP